MHVREARYYRVTVELIAAGGIIQQEGLWGTAGVPVNGMLEKDIPWDCDCLGGFLRVSMACCENRRRNNCYGK